MEVSQLWSVLYFFMLLMLGIGSMLGNTAAILTPLTDSKAVSSRLPKEAISGEWVGQGRQQDSVGRWDVRDRQMDRGLRGLVPVEVATGAVATSWWPCAHLLLTVGHLGPSTSDSPSASGSAPHGAVLVPDAAPRAVRVGQKLLLSAFS